MKVFNGSTPCLDRVKQSNWHMNISAVMFCRVKSESSFKTALKNGNLKSSPWTANENIDQIMLILRMT